MSLIPVMEGADYMYYDKDEYTDEVNWYASLITEALGDKWRLIGVMKTVCRSIRSVQK